MPSLRTIWLALIAIGLTVGLTLLGCTAAQLDRTQQVAGQVQAATTQPATQLIVAGTTAANPGLGAILGSIVIAVAGAASLVTNVAQAMKNNSLTASHNTVMERLISLSTLLTPPVAAPVPTVVAPSPAVLPAGSKQTTLTETQTEPSGQAKS